jgi:DNA-binding response OmpR family regulator
MAIYCPHCEAVLDSGEPVERHGLALAHQIVTLGDEYVQLTASEARIMHGLLERGAMSREALMMRLQSEAETEVLHKLIHGLRRKLAGLTSDVEIRNIWGWGYELAAAVREQNAA